MDVVMASRMDDEDIDLIIQLLQEDCQVAMDAAQGKGKQPEGTETDQQLAFQLLLEELQNAETVAMDRRMTRSIQQAIQADSDALARLRNDERQAQSDRDISIALSNGQVVPAAAPPQDAPQTSGEEDDFLDKLSCIYVTGIEDEADTDSGDDGEETAATSWKRRPESSAWAASRRPPPPRGGSRPRQQQKRNCEACGDRKHFAELARAPCRHEYCRGCLGRLFENAMVDETLFPPRCCKQPIPLHQNLVFLDADVARRFRGKAVEFSTPNRTYCHDGRCRAFVPPSRYVHDAEDGGSVAATARCGECGARTCTACKGAAHRGDCPHDVQLQQVIRLAREQGWQRCRNCWGMVELNMGCNHMTCRCGFQFCYVCGSRWKTCQCEQWDERRLLERAEQIDARDRDRDRDDRDAAPAAAAPMEVVVPAEAAVAPREEAVPPAEPTVVRREDVVLPADAALAARVEEALLQAEAAPRRQLEGARGARIEMLMRDLVANHECEHELWRGRRGPRACEECGDEMPLFIYECRQCHIMACRRCRYHRL
ncbi:hypothetical protein DL766_007819 [Monosporascus sp. MC13-8B]|uniref:RBR-type E3 ubiquitin transferase n=1 Tax=Monosporascus cannonballus TaxID=155416 RepID=A0ABY0GWX1_9PEZI|nr:hypothetical protein DL763_011279 [Monosporascus cannonballus]RYO76228.1 hypothetical protein DL762_009841 [Monosporascus cannonballus]RYP21970.1 hypothetical protein DL766_007819 [Monosporascus sp. MC13-8B]